MSGTSNELHFHRGWRVAKKEKRSDLVLVHAHCTARVGSSSRGPLLTRWATSSKPGLHEPLGDGPMEDNIWRRYKKRNQWLPLFLLQTLSTGLTHCCVVYVMPWFCHDSVSVLCRMTDMYCRTFSNSEQRCYAGEKLEYVRLELFQDLH